MYDEYVIKGNAAVLKCHIPSFVSEYVEIIEWIDSNGGHYSYKQDDSGTYSCNSFPKFFPNPFRNSRTELLQSSV